jgi:hypothetical protein
MGARNVFLDEQARQNFVPPSVLKFPSLEVEVLEPLLRLSRQRAVAVTGYVFPLLFGARPVPLLSLTSLIAWQLRPRREQSAGQMRYCDVDPTESSLDAQRFSTEVENQLHEELATLDGPVTLSELVSRLHALGTRQEVLELLTLTVLRWYAPEDGDRNWNFVSRQSMTNCTESISTATF